MNVTNWSDEDIIQQAELQVFFTSFHTECRLTWQKNRGSKCAILDTVTADIDRFSPEHTCGVIILMGNTGNVQVGGSWKTPSRNSDIMETVVIGEVCHAVGGVSLRWVVVRGRTL
jgi:hypothetical protein